MRVLIVYHSEHHGNTKKLAEAIAQKGNVTLTESSNAKNINWSDYDLIGLASGIYYQKFHDDILQCAKEYLPQGKQVFFLYTCGVKRNTYIDSIKQIADSKNAKIIGSYGCPGFDTFGPFKLIGGIAKGRPNNEDIEGAINFFADICG